MQFLQVLRQHVLRHGPENPEADANGRRGDPGTGSAFGLRQASYQPDGDELRVLPAGKSTGQHWSVRPKMPIHGTCEGNRTGRTPWTGLLKPNMNSCPGKNEVLQSAAPAVDPWSICPTSHARMKLTCFRDVSNIRHMLVTSHKNHSDACL